MAYQALADVMTTQPWRGPAAAAALLLAIASPGSAQRLLEWPVRTAPGAEALVGGAAAAFWNPAAVASPAAPRGEAMALDIEGSEAVGIRGVALAGSFRLGARTVVMGGYNHLGIPDIPHTEDSPVPSALRPSIDVGGDLFTLGAAREVASTWWIGGTLRYWRESAGTFHRDHGLGAGIGFAYRAASPFRPSLAAAVFTGRAEPRWLAGTEVSTPAVAGTRELRLSLGYGVAGGEAPRTVAHRISATSRWADVLTLSAGVDLEPDPGFAVIEPVLAASVRLGRYRLGVLREEIANGFGAAYYSRFHVTF